MNAATGPRQGGSGTRLLAIYENGRVSHHLASDLPSLLQRGDLLVANDAATIPASLHGTHERTGSPIEVRLAGRSSLASEDVQRFTAVVFGAGDFRTPTEHRPDPPQLRCGDELLSGPLRATVAAILGHRRLVELHMNHPPAVIWEALSRHGRPIQYAYVPAPLAIWDTWTSVASRPVAFEAPSAGFVLSWAMLRALRSRGVRFATITHAAGISSTGDDTLDRLLPFDEPYSIPAATAALIGQTRTRGGRIVAVGTTVVRALEHAAGVYVQGTALSRSGRQQGTALSRSGRQEGTALSRSGRHCVVPGDGLATLRITPESDLRVVDAIVSGLHECGSSHYDLLRAFQSDGALEEMTAQAEARGYLAHEFGDAVLISRSRQAFSRRLAAYRRSSWQHVHGRSAAG